MFSFIQKNLLMVATAFAVMGALVIPDVGVAVQKWGVVSPAIFIIFLCQGATVDVSRFRDIGHHARLLFWGFLVTFLFAPFLGWATMSVLHWEGDFRLGFLLMCSMGPTLVSGIIISNRAGGEAESATLLTIVLNLLAVLMIPIALGITAGSGNSLDQGALLLKLVMLVLLPAMLGQGLRLLWPKFIAERQKLLKDLPVYLLALNIFVSLAEQNGNLYEIELIRLLAMIPPALFVHYSLFGIGYWGVTRILRTTPQSATSLAFVCSQKTLPVAIALWATELATTYPLAILPPIIFHLTQIAGDSILAGWWKRWFDKQKQSKVYNFVDAKSSTGSSQEFHTLDAK
jgi:predicted Na+-dependent transporter